LENGIIYNAVKHCSEQKAGIMTQCFKADIMHTMPRGYWDTFLLKVNGKIGGQNTAIAMGDLASLPFDAARTMMVGIDVTHPGQNDRVSSSVAAAVGSYDAMFTRYNTSIKVQYRERDETVKQLDEMMADLLAQYYRVNKYFPENVIIFRDGLFI